MLLTSWQKGLGWFDRPVGESYDVGEDSGLGLGVRAVMEQETDISPATRRKPWVHPPFNENAAWHPVKDDAGRVRGKLSTEQGPKFHVEIVERSCFSPERTRRSKLPLKACVAPGHRSHVRVDA